MPAEKSRKKPQSPVGKEATQAPVPTPPQPFGIDPSWELVPVDILSSKEGWTEYELEDGSRLRVKAAVLDVKRAVGQFNPEGEPLYLAQATMVIRTISPPEMKKKKTVG